MKSNPKQAKTARIPIKNGLFFTVDAEDFKLYSGLKWTIEYGHVRVDGDKPDWMTHPVLARHLAGAEIGTWMLYKDDCGVNLTKDNVLALPPDKWREYRRNHPAPDQDARTPTLVGTAWCQRMNAWTTPFYAKRPRHPGAEFFASQADVVAFAEAQRELRRRGASWVGADDSEQPAIKISERNEVIPLFAATSPMTLGLMGGKGSHSAAMVWLALRFFALKEGKSHCFASREVIKRMLGWPNVETVSDALKRLREVGAIDYEPTRRSQVSRDGSDYFRKWQCHQVVIQRTSEDNEPGFFPSELFNDERFHDLSFKAQATLVALYLLAKARSQVTFSLEALRAEAMLSEKHVLLALDELSEASLIKGYRKRNPGEHLGELRHAMTLSFNDFEKLD